MKLNYKKIGLATAACVLLSISSEAAVTLTFEQVGNNVTATWSGSYNVPFNLTIQGGGPFTPLVNEVAVLGIPESFYKITGGGTATVTGLINRPASYVGTVFGFAFADVFLPSGVEEEVLYSPNGTFTFENMTLSSLGATSFNNTLAYTGSGNIGSNQQVFFTTAIPEPSSAVLAGLGVLGLIRRKR